MNNRGQKLGWVITGSGHFFEECLDFMSSLGEFDLFVSKAAEEVVRMYKKKNPSFPAKTRVFRDTTASSAPVGLFYKNYYVFNCYYNSSFCYLFFSWKQCSNTKTNKKYNT